MVLYGQKSNDSRSEGGLIGRNSGSKRWDKTVATLSLPAQAGLTTTLLTFNASAVKSRPASFPCANGECQREGQVSLAQSLPYGGQFAIQEGAQWRTPHSLIYLCVIINHKYKPYKAALNL